ncbi:MAG: hypothetical protein OEV49_03685 [candidate division Zixibacteria bacterium]|nr:hypothetical protein [candidate division Zixibacteria bacterium]MDH3936850.1 hypothetical protein [candidate division Zixibacteria bacterium]MDH4033143.1 hypothetical protein [candidate division Zixibacteria bacterium]
MSLLRTCRVTVWVIVGLLTSGQSGAFDFGGYFKKFGSVYDLPSHSLSGLVEDPPALGRFISRMRLQSRLTLGDHGSFNVAYDFAPRIEDELLRQANLFLNDSPSSSYRAFDFDQPLYPNPDDSTASFSIHHNLDRVELTINAGRFDLFLGRQAVAWGSSRTINPTDVVAPFGYTELDTEDRAGVDGVRLRIPVGFMAEIDAGYLFGEDFRFEQSAFFVRVKQYLARTDATVLVVGFRENLLLGVDLARSVGGAGVWVEGGYVLDNVLANQRRPDYQNYLRATIGMDYSLAATLYGFVEYHYNGPGGQAENFQDNTTATAYTAGGVYLMGRHYLVPGAVWQITPLATFGGEVLANLNDPSILLAPSLEYNVAANVYLSAGAFIGVGKRVAIELGENLKLDQFRLRSEFGTYPDIYHTSFRVYF